MVGEAVGGLGDLDSRVLPLKGQTWHCGSRGSNHASAGTKGATAFVHICTCLESFTIFRTLMNMSWKDKLR